MTPTAALAFQSTGAAFSVSGVPIATDTAVVEAGLDWRITAQMKFGIGYQGELAKTANTNMAKGNSTWNFEGPEYLARAFATRSTVIARLDRATQYSDASAMESKGPGVLDPPLSRRMTG